MCHFSIGILRQVWYLIVSIPDLCTFTYFVCNFGVDEMFTSEKKNDTILVHSTNSTKRSIDQGPVA